MIFISVDFPAPFSPTIPRNSPLFSLKEIFSQLLACVLFFRRN